MNSKELEMFVQDLRELENMAEAIWYYVGEPDMQTKAIRLCGKIRAEAGRLKRYAMLCQEQIGGNVK